MENVYLLELIASMEHELEEHKHGQFAGNDKHSGCCERITTTINALKAQLENPPTLPDQYTQNTEDPGAARGEELESVKLLDQLASELDKHGIQKEAEQAREHARELLAAQLYEFDGFDNGRNLH